MFSLHGEMDYFSSPKCGLYLARQLKRAFGKVTQAREGGSI
jgi:hypothetical protein